MKPRNWFPLDLVALLSFPIVVFAMMLVMAPIFLVIHWLHHPTPVSWLWAFAVASSVLMVGLVLLFFAKLPQYRAGVFLRIGFRHLPPRNQRLYRVAFWLIVPAVLVLLALLGTVHQSR